MSRVMTIIICLVGLCVLTMASDLTTLPLRIEGTKVPSEAEAKRLARNSYVEKMGTRLMAEEGVQSLTIITLGYNVPGFANKGERIWEARVMAFFDRELRAIIWVNPRTEKVFFVCGPWETKSAE